MNRLPKIIYTLTLFIHSIGLSNAQPTGYYNGIENLRGTDLQMALYQRIRNHRTFTYDKAKEILSQSDTDPNNAANVICVYTGRSQNAFDYGSTGNQLNREHVWAKSHGDFGTTAPAGSDVHNLKPSDASVNSSRSNKDFDDCSASGKQHSEATNCYYTDVAWEPGDNVKGDIARIIFYMASRYKGDNGEPNLSAVDAVNTAPAPLHGKLTTLLRWNHMDPPDDFERRRNNVIFSWQQNRNPFVDYPFLADIIWAQKTWPSISIGHLAQNPASPTKTDTISISAKISSDKPITFARFVYGTNYTQDIDTIVLPQDTGVVNIRINPVEGANQIFYRFEAANETDTLIWHGFYQLKSNFQGTITPIKQIQGQANSSVYDNQIVSTAGIVTATGNNGYYLQSGAQTWSGIYVFDPINKPIRGDSVIITGMVDEYYTLTEFKNITYFEIQTSNNPLPSSQEISVADIATGSAAFEQYEGVLVKLNDAVCSALANSYGEWKVSQNNQDALIVNGDGMFFTPVINTSYSLTGIATYNFGTNRLELRDLNDIALSTNLNLSVINPLSVFPNPATDVVWIKGDFTENVKLNIYNALGQAIEGYTCMHTPDNIECHLPVFLHEGLYLIHITDRNQTSIVKIIKSISN